MNNSDLSSRLIQAQFHISHTNDSSRQLRIIVCDKCNENLPYQKPFLGSHMDLYLDNTLLWYTRPI